MSGKEHKQTLLNDFYKPAPNKVSSLKRKHFDSNPEDMSYASKLSKTDGTQSQDSSNSENKWKKPHSTSVSFDQESKIDFPDLQQDRKDKNESSSEENGKKKSYTSGQHSQSTKTGSVLFSHASSLSQGPKSATDIPTPDKHIFCEKGHNRSSTFFAHNEIGCSQTLRECEPKLLMGMKKSESSVSSNQKKHSSSSTAKVDDSDTIRKLTLEEGDQGKLVNKHKSIFQDSNSKRDDWNVCDIELKPLNSSHNHRILIDYTSISKSSPPKPFPSQRVSFHESGSSFDCVLMPYFTKMQNPPKSNSWRSDQSYPKPRWSVIQQALNKNIADVFALEEAIKSYNLNYKDRWDFDGLYSFFDNMPDNERDNFFQVTLSEMRHLALKLEEICTKPLPILKQEKSMKITISQQQAACLLANAFFCTFPSRNHKSKDVKLPDINFSNLYSSDKVERKAEKLKCLIHYFERVTTKMPTGTLTFTRQCHKKTINWEEEDCRIKDIKVDAESAIEDIGKGMLQADFANKMVGGGVLGKGLVQEEIRFIICPEMIVSRLFTETLTKDEVLIMTGCERFCNYTGYSDSFKFDGDHIDESNRDTWERCKVDVVAMDALVIRSHRDQFMPDQLKRELHKAHCAFVDEYRKSEITESLQSYSPSPVCTGNWGCGAFRGDKHLKAVIQMMAASKAERNIYYCTFGDKKFTEELEKLNAILQAEKIKIKKMMKWISEYSSKNIFSKKTLFEYIFEQT